MDLIKTGKLIKDARKKKGLTQEDIARKLNITSKSVSKWERGVNFPDSALITELGQILGLTTDEIIEGKRKEVPKNIKKKIFIILAILLMIVNFSVIGVLSYSFYRNYNRSRLYRIYSENEDFKVSGYLSVNYDYNILMINKFIYQGDLIGSSKESEIDSIDLIIKNNDKSYDYYFRTSKKEFISEFLNDKGIMLELKNYDMGDITLIIKFDDKQYFIELRTAELYSNNKFFN